MIDKELLIKSLLEKIATKEFHDNTAARIKKEAEFYEKLERLQADAASRLQVFNI